MRRQRDGLAERLVEAHHVDAAEFMHLMTMGGLAPFLKAAVPELTCMRASLVVAYKDYKGDQATEVVR